jgi:RND family efflux transporter MFP subunit
MKTDPHHIAPGEAFPGSAGVPPAVSRILRDTSDVECALGCQRTPVCAAQDARHGGRDARATRGIAVLFLALCATLHAAEPMPVKFASAKRAEIHRWITIPGTLKANQQATLYAKVAGYVTKMAVDRGDTVKADQPLAELEVPELLADGKKFEADVKVAEIELSRLTEAQKKAPDLVLPQALDKARGAADVARANLERTNTLLHFAKITAPFPGMITGRFVDNGAFVPSATSGSAAQNAAIFTLMDFTTIRAQAAVPETESSFIRPGLPVKFTLEALPGKTFDATVSRSNGVLDEATRTMLTEADIANADGALKPGMYANIRIAVEKHTGAIIIPVEALVMEKTNAFVFKVADGKAKKVAVKTGFNDGVSAEITEGLAYGEGVIVPGKVPPADGQPVKDEATK